MTSLGVFVAERPILAPSVLKREPLLLMDGVRVHSPTLSFPTLKKSLRPLLTPVQATRNRLWGIRSSRRLERVRRLKQCSKAYC
jgi:hypothetical protein